MRRSELLPIQRYRLMDKADRLLNLVSDYSRDKMGEDRYHSISQRFHLTTPSIAVRKRCFGEVNDLYGPLVEPPYGRMGLANIKYDLSGLHPHIRHYLRGSFINKSIIPIVNDVQKYIL